MAHKCTGIAIFSGEKVAELMNYLEHINTLYPNKIGQMLVHNYDSSLDNLFIETRNKISFTTDWAPDETIIKKLADMFGLWFIYQYEELASYEYGEYTYINNVLSKVHVLAHVIQSITEREYQYEYNGKLYESRYDILDKYIEMRKHVIKS